MSVAVGGRSLDLRVEQFCVLLFVVFGIIKKFEGIVNADYHSGLFFPFPDTLVVSLQQDAGPVPEHGSQKLSVCCFH